MAARLGGGCAGGSQIRDWTGRVRQSPAEERFRGSRVLRYIDLGAAKINAESARRVTRRVTPDRNSRVGSRALRHRYGRGLADSVNKRLI